MSTKIWCHYNNIPCHVRSWLSKLVCSVAASFTHLISIAFVKWDWLKNKPNTVLSEEQACYGHRKPNDSYGVLPHTVPPPRSQRNKMVKQLAWCSLWDISQKAAKNKSTKSYLCCLTRGKRERTNCLIMITNRWQWWYLEAVHVIPLERTVCSSHCQMLGAWNGTGESPRQILFRQL